jgi:ABC-type molybdate transport system permease subunit
MTHKIKFATVVLRISTAIYVLLGLFLFALSFSAGTQNKSSVVIMDIALGLFVLGLAVGVEFVRRGIINRKFWAWVAGLCIFGVYTPSIFFPLGLLGFWGLLAKGSRAEFGVGVTPSES